MWKVLGVLVVLSCTSLLEADEDSFSRDLTNATNRFSLDLLREIFKGNSRNVVISPVSIYILLAILQQGARGTTRVEVDNVVHAKPEDTRRSFRSLTRMYKDSSVATMKLHFSTRAFAPSRFQLKKDFSKMLMGDFQCGIDNVNFTNSEKAAAFINHWVSKSTKDKIKELFKPNAFKPTTALVLVNAVYFSGEWLHRFSQMESTFSPSAGKELLIPTLKQTEEYHGGEISNIGLKYVQLSLKFAYPFSVVLVLPTKRYGLDKLVEQLTPDILTKIFNGHIRKRVHLQFPKFKLNTDSNLIPLLKKLGINKVFEATADLSGITDQDILVSEMIQKAVIDANEHGISAAASTEATFVFKSSYMPRKLEEMNFTADHPFLFFIVDRQNKVPLFAGRVTDPFKSND